MKRIIRKVAVLGSGVMGSGSPVISREQVFRYYCWTAYLQN